MLFCFCYCFIILTNLALQTQPQHLTIEDIHWGVATGGDYKGRRTVTLKSDHDGQKGNDLTIANYTCENDGDYKYIPFPEEPDNPLCLYSLLHKHINEHMSPDCSDTRIFRREASEKQKKVRLII